MFIYIAVIIVIFVCFGLFCLCEPCVEKYCYKNTRKVIAL